MSMSYEPQINAFMIGFKALKPSVYHQTLWVYTNVKECNNLMNWQI